MYPVGPIGAAGDRTAPCAEPDGGSRFESDPIAMIRFLQINLRKSGLARRLMEQTARKLGADLLILSEVPQGTLDTAS